VESERGALRRSDAGALASEAGQSAHRGVAISLRVKALAGAVLLVASTSTVIGVAVLRITESEARRSFATSFGSCSFAEPVAGLRELGLLAGS